MSIRNAIKSVISEFNCTDSANLYVKGVIQSLATWELYSSNEEWIDARREDLLTEVLFNDDLVCGPMNFYLTLGEYLVLKGLVNQGHPGTSS